MKKHVTKLTALALVLLMAMSIMLFAPSMELQAEEVISHETNPELSFAVIDIVPTASVASDAPLFSPSKLVLGAVKMLASRAFQELAAYSIADDVPGLSTFFKLLQTPAQRSAMAQKQQIAQIAATVQEINATVARIEADIAELDKKIDQYEAAGALRDQTNRLHEITNTYKPAWFAYEQVVALTEALADNQGQLKTQTEMLAQLEEQAKTASGSELDAIQKDIATVENNILKLKAAIDGNDDVFAALQATLETKKAELAAIREQKAQTTDPTAFMELQKKDDALTAEIAELQKQIDETVVVEGLNDKIDAAMLSTIALLEEGGSPKFSADLTDLTEIIWNTNAPNNCYLGAYEKYLRQVYDFEHEISDQLSIAFENTVDIMNQVYTLYIQYYVYKRMDTSDPNAESYQQTYTDAYFMGVQERIINNFNIIADISGYDQLMVMKDFTAEQLADFRENDPDYMPPENINQTIEINQTTYNCYKVRDNKTLRYYIILTDFIGNQKIVTKTQPCYITQDGFPGSMFEIHDTYLFRPKYVLDYKYTDNGAYRLISSAEIPAFIKNASVIRSALRVGDNVILKDGTEINTGLTKIPESAEYILLQDSSCAYDYYAEDTYWDMNVLTMSQSGTQKISKVSSKSIYNDAKYNNTILIYQDISGGNYVNGVWKAVDRGELEKRTIMIGDGQTLDLTNISLDINNVEIHMTGNAKLISNPKITLKQSAIYIYSTGNVEITNLNLTGKNYETAAVTVYVPKGSANAGVYFKGTNSVKASCEKLTQVKGMEDASDERPFVASSGIYIYGKGTGNIYIDKATFEGAAGGAGICADTKVNFDKVNGASSPKLVAIGSEFCSIEKDMQSFHEPTGGGAGIGVSFTGLMDVGDIFQDYKVDFDYEYHTLGTKGELSFKNLTIEAKGYTYEDDAWITDDIGAVKAGSKTFDVKSITISNCSVALDRMKKTSKLTFSGDVRMLPDVYTVTAYTKGSSGVTDDGVYFKFIGSEGETDWVHVSIGDDKDNHTVSVQADAVGKLKEVKVKTKSSNHWYPGKIEVQNTLSTGKYASGKLTVYGGRWIGNSETLLSPDDDIYEVTVKTGSSANAGTNAEIWLQLQDANGNQSAKIQLDDIHQDKNAFEKGDTDTFPIYVPDQFEECVYAFLRSDNSGSAAGWQVDEISIKKVSGNNLLGDGYTVSTGYWYEYAQTVNFGKYSGGTGLFRVDIKTSNVKKAGTDSDIWLTICGTKGDTEEINISDLAGDGNNFEKGDLDSFYIGYNKDSIGTIKSIKIRKNNFGAGADWHLEYITIVEEIANGQNGQSAKFICDDWIENETKELKNPTTNMIRQSVTRFDREVLKGLTANEDGSYTLTVSQEIVLTDDVLNYLAESDKKLTVVMQNQEKTIYEAVFDGTLFESAETVILDKDYSFADGRALFEFIQDAVLPEGTILKLHMNSAEFVQLGSYVLFNKDSEGVWSKIEKVESKDGVITFAPEILKEMMISETDNTWVKFPQIDDWAYGAEAAEPIAQAVYGDFSVRYVGTANDGTEWDSTEAPSKAGNYVAVFTVEATDDHSGLTYEVEFAIEKAEQTIVLETDARTAECKEILPAIAVRAEGALSYESADPTVATVDALGRVTALTAGKTVITVRAAETANYEAAVATYTVTVDHTYSEKWNKNSDGHWHVCVCGAKSETEAHVKGFAATHNSAQLCKVCQYVMTPALGHDYADAWTYDDVYHWYACSCGKKKNMDKHDFEEIVTDAAKLADADCEHGTLYYKTCADCGYFGTETFEAGEAISHSFSVYISDGNATCAADGTKTAKCDHCDVTDTKTDTGSKKAHTFTNYVSDGNATCAINGTKTAKCDVCGASDTVIDTESKTDHSFTSYVSDGNATCEADGTKTAKCDHCDETDTKTDSGSKKAHSFEKGVCTDCETEDPDYTNLTWLWIVLAIVVVAGGGVAVYFFVIRKKK